jgi:hypothetical protein
MLRVVKWVIIVENIVIIGQWCNGIKCHKITAIGLPQVHANHLYLSHLDRQIIVQDLRKSTLRYFKSDMKL